MKVTKCKDKIKIGDYIVSDAFGNGILDNLYLGTITSINSNEFVVRAEGHPLSIDVSEMEIIADEDSPNVFAVFFDNTEGAVDILPPKSEVEKGTLYLGSSEGIHKFPEDNSAEYPEVPRINPFSF